MANDAVEAAIKASMTEAGIEPTDEDTGESHEESGEVEASSGDDGGDAGGEGGDTGGAGDASDEGRVADAPADKKDEGKSDAKKDDEDEELEKLLIEHGITPPKPGQREGHYSRTRFRQVLKGSIKKVKEGLAKKYSTEGAAALEQLKSMQTKLAEMETHLKPEVLQLIANDPRRYLEGLSQRFPQYKEFLVKPAGPDPLAALGPKPAPDVRFTDGSVGYSEAQQKKLDEWADKRTMVMAEAKAQEILSPIQRERQAAATRAGLMPKIQAQMKWASDTFGKHFTDDVGDPNQPNPNSEIGKLLQQGLTFEQAVIQVCYPKQRASWNAREEELKTEAQKAREKALEEIKKTPLRGTIAAPSGTGRSSNEPKTTEDIIKNAMRQAGIGNT